MVENSFGTDGLWLIKLKTEWGNIVYVSSEHIVFDGKCYTLGDVADMVKYCTETFSGWNGVSVRENDLSANKEDNKMSKDTVVTYGDIKMVTLISELQGILDNANGAEVNVVVAEVRYEVKDGDVDPGALTL